MVIDLGGGTADMTVHEKLSTGLLKELFKGSGGACGGTAVESKVLDVFEEIVGNEVFSEFKWKYVERYMDLLREIDVFKRNIKPESDVKIKLAIPLMCLDEICLKMRNKHFKDLLAKSSMSKHIFLTGDKLRFSADFARQLFTSITDQIVEYIRVILQHPEVESVNRFLLVGGFSESPMVQHAIKTHFPGKQLIIPQDAVLAVVKGAVLFGHRPTSIKSRIIKYSYGVKTLPVFDPMVHDIKKRFFIDGEDRCKDVFSSFMRSGTPAEINLEVEKKYQTYRPFQKTVSLDVFYTVDENPKYIDEKRVRKLGNLDVTIPYPSKNPRIVKVIYVFGDTELKVKAVDMETGMPCEIIIT